MQGGLGKAQADGAPAAERRFASPCCFCRRRRNAVFSAVVLLDSLVRLARGHSLTSLQVFLSLTSLQVFLGRGGSGRREVFRCAELAFRAGPLGVDGPASPHTRPHATAQPMGLRSPGQHVAERGILSQVSRTSEPQICSAGVHLVGVWGLQIDHFWIITSGL